MQKKLLCMFFQKSETDMTIEYIQTIFNPERLFIFENTQNTNQLFCTFSIDAPRPLINRIIIIHRRSETNTLYTINAVNEIIKKTNNGKLIHNYPIDWTLYRNTLLLYRGGELEKINFTIYDKIS